MTRKKKGKKGRREEEPRVGSVYRHYKAKMAAIRAAHERGVLSGNAPRTIHE